MPLDVTVTYKNGDTELYYIPLRMMRGEKSGDVLTTMESQILSDWPWVQKTYSFTIPAKYKKIKSIEIDASKRLADINRSDNFYKLK